MSLKNNLLDDLIKTLDKPPLKPEEYNLVLDGGAMNGGFLVGILLYIRELENKKYITINKISGSSVGTFCGFCYLDNNLELYEQIYCQSRNSIIRDLNLKVCGNLLKSYIDSKDADFYKKFNNKLYINFYDINKKQDVVTSKFKDNNDLYMKIRFSTFLPLVFDGFITFNNKIDALIPHVFYNEKNVLFFNLTTLKKLFYCMNVSEKNNVFKIMHGIIDMHQFFTTRGKTELCSFVNEWTSYEHFLFYIRYQIANLIKLSVVYLHKLLEFYKDHNEEYKAILIKYISDNIRKFILCN